MLNMSLRTTGAASAATLTGAQRAWALCVGLEGESAGTVLKLLALQGYAVAHGYSASVEPAGLCKGPCLAVVVPWTCWDDAGGVLDRGSRTLLVRTFRGLRAVLGA